MVVGYKPQGIRRSIAANTNTPPQDPPPSIIFETPVIIEPVIVPKIVIPKKVITKKKPIVQKKITIRQRIIAFLKKLVMRK